MSLSAETEKAKNVKKRQDIVLGVCLAMVAGFLVNLSSSVYYDIFISKTLLFSDTPSMALTTVLVLLVFFEAFLEFLIYDVQQGQSIHINKRFWGRFFDFVDKKHWASKMMNSTGRVIWAAVKFILWMIVLLSLWSVDDWLPVVLFVCATILYQGMKRGLFRNRKKKVLS